VHALPGQLGPSGPGGVAATSTVLAVHARSAVRGAWVIDPAHWDGLPDGHTRSTVLDPARRSADHDPAAVTGEAPNPLQALLIRSSAAATPVARRALSSYDTAGGLTPTPTSGDSR